MEIKSQNGRVSNEGIDSGISLQSWSQKKKNLF